MLLSAWYLESEAYFLGATIAVAELINIAPNSVDNHAAYSLLDDNDNDFD